MIQEYSERQFNEPGKKINKQKEYFTKDIETIKNQILELKKSINEMRIALGSFRNRANEMEEKYASPEIET